MDTKTTISITEARKQIYKIVDEVATANTYYTITEKGKPKAVIISSEEFESWMETLEVMRAWPDYKKDIKKINKDIQTGKYKSYPTLEEVMLGQGYVFSDKKAKYEISNKIRTKRNKTTKKNTK